VRKVCAHSWATNLEPRAWSFPSARIRAWIRPRS
jgi:hypothetical protein